jgi:NAD(P)-dependent dehydrogenase (short-subunit alcohol dehydrogenase family)
MMLDEKVAVIYGAGGSVGAAVARAFAAEGASVHLTGRRPEPLAHLPHTTTAVVDALDERAVEDHLAGVLDRHGRVDVSINLVAIDHVQGVPLIDMPVDDFTRGFDQRMRSQFLTARAAARPMTERGSGVILALTAAPDRTAIGRAGSFGMQCAAVESFIRTLAVELGPHGVRAACIRSAGSPDAAGVDEVFTLHAGRAGVSREDYDRAKARGTLLGRMPALAEIGRLAAFLASDHAGALTATIVNATCGELLD